jgi:hypothetical protein
MAFRCEVSPVEEPVVTWENSLHGCRMRCKVRCRDEQ